MMPTPQDDEKQGTWQAPEQVGGPASSTFAVALDPFGLELHPHPTNDALDPLNWSKTERYGILTIVCAANFLALYCTTTSVPSFFLLEEQFNATYSEVNWSLAVPALGLALGPLCFSSLAEIWGRRIVMVCSATLSLLMTGCVTIPGISFGCYIACRFLQGLFAGPSSSVAFGIVRDISWQHERGKFTGFWVLSFDLGFVSGGIIGGFTAMVSAEWAQYHVAIAFFILLVAELLFLPETIYPRDEVVRLEREGGLDSLTRTKRLGFLNRSPVPGVPHPHVWSAIANFVRLWSYPKITITVLPFILLQYSWVVSMVTMEPAAYSQYPSQIQGLFFIGMVVGNVASELLCSGRVSDYLCARQALRNNGVRSAEMRLSLCYLGVIFGSIGPILWGFAIDRGWHWLIGEIAFVIVAAGLQISGAAIITFLFESYPDNVLDVFRFYLVVANVAAFVNPFYINYWVTTFHFTWTFVTQGLIALLVIPFIWSAQKFGPRMHKVMDLYDHH